jgi:lipoprotein-anchoring transpeptidase ErfK/SrfK
VPDSVIVTPKPADWPAAVVPGAPAEATPSLERPPAPPAVVSEPPVLAQTVPSGALDQPLPPADQPLVPPAPIEVTYEVEATYQPASVALTEASAAADQALTEPSAAVGSDQSVVDSPITDGSRAETLSENEPTAEVEVSSAAEGTGMAAAVPAPEADPGGLVDPVDLDETVLADPIDLTETAQSQIAPVEPTVPALDPSLFRPDPVQPSTGPADGPVPVRPDAPPARAVATPLQPARSTAAKPRHRGRLAALIALLVVALAAGGGAVFASRHFVDRAKPGVTIAAVGVTGQDAAQLRQTVERLVAELRLPLVLGRTEAQAGSRDLGLTVDVDQTVAQALAATAGRPFWTAYNPFWKKPVALVHSLDSERLQTFLNQRFVDANQATADASVVFDEASGRFQVQASKVGVGVDAGPVIEALRGWAEGSRGLAPVKLSTAIEQPRVGDAAAQAAADQANGRLGLTIVVDNGASGDRRRAYQVSPAEVAAWTVLTPDPDSGQILVSYDQAKIAAEVTAQVNEQIGRPVVNEFKVLHPATRAKLGVTRAGQDGIVVTDLGPAVAGVQEALAAGQDRTVTVPTETVPYQREEGLPPDNYGDPNGAKWIDVNLTTHIVTLFEGTTPINSFLVTTGAPSSRTRTGVNYIREKYEHQVMVNRDPDDYYELPTDWVAYFDGGIAFHSAPWRIARNEWGYNLSHGCVNMKPEHADILWHWAPLGTKVDVHY